MKQTYVPPSGNQDAKLAGVGEQPGIQEVRQGRPFVGPAGHGLDECLQMARILRHSLYLTNVIKDLDAPLSKYINIKQGGNYTISKEGYIYIQELGEELSKLNLNAVVAFGNVALVALTNRVGITKWRGSVVESTIVPGLKVIPTFHPATFIIPKFNYLNKPLIISDLMLAIKESEFPELKTTPRKVKIRVSFDEAVAILNHCYELGTHGRTIDIDIEVINGEVDCISFAWEDTNSCSIPFRFSQSDMEWSMSL